MGRIAADLACGEAGDGDPYDARRSVPRRSSLPSTTALQPSNSASAAARGTDTTASTSAGWSRYAPSGRSERRAKTSWTSLSFPAIPWAKRRPSRVRSTNVTSSPISSSASRIAWAKRLTSAEMPAHGDVERARPRVLRLRPSLEEGERPSVLVDASDPDVERTVPVAVTVDVASGFDGAGMATLLVQDVERFVLRIGGGADSAQNRSSTCSRAPAATSCSVSSLRPGRTSRCMTPSSSSRYWPTQSSRGE